MKKSAIILALALGVSAWSTMAQEQGAPPPPGERPPGREGGPAGPGGPGGRGGFHLLPPPVQEQLKLTADQQKQVAALEAELKAKLEKILTAEQLKQLQQMRPPPRPGGMGGAGPDSGQGGPGGPPLGDGKSSPRQRPQSE